MPSKSKHTGNLAELTARTYLEQSGLKFIQQNFHSRFGEIDLIMQDNDTVVFVEVKKRKQGINHALESITLSKQKKLVLTAQYYLLKAQKEINCRFDVIAIDANNQVEWHKNVIIV